MCSSDLYLRQLLDCMHEEVLKARGVKLSDGRIAETTVISRVFGGYLCNELRCLECKYSSKTWNHFQDLSLEVSGGISSVAGALKAFIKPEKLSHGNEWKCDGCKKKVQAVKQMTVSRSPNVLVVHLKRFSYGGFMGKITKPIDFDFELEVPCSGEGAAVPASAAASSSSSGSSSGFGPGSGTGPAKGGAGHKAGKKHQRVHDTAGTPGARAMYDLVGVVVHHGGSIHSGHYVAFVKVPY